MPEDVQPADVSKIELVECEAVLDLYAAAPASVRSELGIEHRAVDGGGALLVCRGIDNLQFNRLVGFGVASPARAEALDGALAEFDRAGVRNWVVHVAEGTGELAGMCSARGLAPHPRTWAKFIRGGETVAAGTTLQVREATSAEAAAFGGIAAGTYGLPPAAADWIAALAGRPGWHCLMAFDQGTPVATGAVFVSGDAAWLGLGATVPSHRRQGAQSALLAGRIHAAARQGCRVLTTETGVPHPGEAGPSYANIQRAGFRIAYARPNFRRP
jgi:GNAT superfamily N-acetyltransferase